MPKILIFQSSDDSLSDFIVEDCEISQEMVRAVIAVIHHVLGLESDTCTYIHV